MYLPLACSCTKYCVVRILFSGCLLYLPLPQNYLVIDMVLDVGPRVREWVGKIGPSVLDIYGGGGGGGALFPPRIPLPLLLSFFLLLRSLFLPFPLLPLSRPSFTTFAQSESASALTLAVWKAITARSFSLWEGLGSLAAARVVAMLLHPGKHDSAQITILSRSA